MDDRTARTVQELFPNRSPASRARRTAPGARTPVPRQAPGVSTPSPRQPNAWLRPRRLRRRRLKAHTMATAAADDSKKYRNGDDQVAPVLRARNHTRRRAPAERGNPRPRCSEAPRHRLQATRTTGGALQPPRRGNSLTHTKSQMTWTRGRVRPASTPGFRWCDEILTARRPGRHPTIFTQGISRFAAMTAARNGARSGRVGLEDHQQGDQPEAPGEDATREQRLPPERAPDMARNLSTRINLAESHAETSTVTVGSLNDSQPAISGRTPGRSRRAEHPTLIGWRHASFCHRYGKHGSCVRRSCARNGPSRSPCGTEQRIELTI